MNTEAVWEYLNANQVHNDSSRCVKEKNLMKGLSPVAKSGVEILEGINKEEFVERFSDKPCILKGLAEEWPARTKWKDREAFLEHYGETTFKVTEMCPANGMGKPLPLRISFEEYFRYASANDSDYPWYCFGDNFEDSRAGLLQDVALPPLFTDDVYEGYRHFFPVYRYMVIGGDRTGTHVHIDPKHTCAFNTLLSGHKRWVLFPPSVDKSELHPGTQSDPVTHWWLDVYQKTLVDQGKGKSLGMIDVVQGPGETIWVPTGWWHAVLNIGDTIAYTQNSLPGYKLPGLWPCISAYDADQVAALSAAVAISHPDVHALLPACDRSMKKPPKNVLFLDVDGVLHPLRLELVNGVSDSAHLFNPTCMRLLKEIVERGHAKIVLSSSWRMFEHSRVKLQNALCDHSIAPFTEWTTLLEDSAGRAGQILRYVQDHGDEIDEWAVLDDEDIIDGRGGMLMQVLQARWVRTDKEKGLTQKDADDIIAILLDDDE
eukprot:TRINITY_DN1720_c1_g1_i1.p1 TRINITY_DN1720_c1_g1~~TRINITY_DN1720_c1_g1_i1.p1  ORF type:complete len:487 (+),score=122.15 TRINITY_DN1720_c1_g1_i1:36-1496(+)